MGVRACVGQVLMDHGDRATGEAHRAETERLLSEARDYSPRVSFAVAPHSIYTVSEDLLRWAAELALAHGRVLHIHVSETESEVASCQAEHGCSPVEYLDRLGALSERTVAAHTVWLSDHDVEILGERRVVCVHNPVSNMKLAVGGVFPYRKLAAAGAVCAIATDGAGSNNSLDLFQELKFAALLQKFQDRDTTSLTASQALDMALVNPAPVFGLPGPTLEVGRPADLILIDTTGPEMQPPHSLTSNLVYSATGNVVDSAVCEGKVVMRHREIEGEDEIIAAACDAATRLFDRVDG
jgi:5-methylthioadenosine/S-adenosylhomocysteine deaminase